MKISYHDNPNLDINYNGKVIEVHVDGEYVGIAFRDGQISTNSSQMRNAWKYCLVDDWDNRKITLQVGDPGYVSGTLGELKKLIKEYYAG